MLTCALCDVDHSRGSPDCPATRVGRTVGGRYRLDRLLGVGGMGAVYEACHLELGSRVALKMLHPRMVTNTQLAARFRVEAQRAADIRHPGIVDVRDLGQDESGCPFMAMELLEGSNLEAAIERGPLPLEQVVSVADQALDALAAAHARGVIHRDLKPANLFLTHDARGAAVVKILDFGIAKIVDGTASMTRTGLTMGTVEYMSPEQIRDSKSIDARADLYSMGVTLYEMLTGRRNASGDTPIEVVARVVQGQVERHPARLRPDVPAWLDALVARALDPAVEGRFASAADMLQALRRGVSAGPGPARDGHAAVAATVAATFAPSAGSVASGYGQPVTPATGPLAPGYAAPATPAPATPTPAPTMWAAPAATGSPTGGAYAPPAVRPSGGGRGWIVAVGVLALLGGLVAIAVTAIALRRARRSRAEPVAAAAAAPTVPDALPPPGPVAPAPPTPPVTPPALAPSAAPSSAPPPPLTPVPAVAAVAPVPSAISAVAAPTATGAALADFAGRFALSGRVVRDECRRQVYLAARHVTVDAEAGTMFADVVRRTYAARVENGRLVAEGSFPNPLCRGDRLVERWVFERTGPGTLSGALDSRWSLPPRCATPCTVSFSLAAAPAPAVAPRRRPRLGGRGGSAAAGY